MITILGPTVNVIVGVDNGVDLNLLTRRSGLVSESVHLIPYILSTWDLRASANFWLN
jgi:hypothetical protein